MRCPPKIAIGPAPQPCALAGALQARGIAALDAGGRVGAGWGSRVGERTPASSYLLAEPEVVFRGGFEVLVEAREWLDPGPDRDPGERMLAGFLSYDQGALDSKPIEPVCLAGYRAVYRQRSNVEVEVVGSDAAAMSSLADQIRSAALHVVPDPVCLSDPDSAFSLPVYLAAIAKIQDYIRAGDVYQVNLARRLRYADVKPWELAAMYEQLCLHHPAPFGAFLRHADLTVISNSPERFLRLEGDQLETCPIKGTRPRGRTPEEDGWMAKELLSSQKDQAEHIMIVDLERNDLGRICATGSVRVDRLAELESFANVHHLVSSVRGRVRDPGDWRGILSAMFPSGSITGAPKLRAMEIIRELEPVPRGIYTGAVGVFDANGGIDLSLAIRTGVARDGQLDLHFGGGIIADSDPRSEFAETRDKGAAFSSVAHR